MSYSKGDLVGPFMTWSQTSKWKQTPDQWTVTLYQKAWPVTH